MFTDLLRQRSGQKLSLMTALKLVSATFTDMPTISDAELRMFCRIPYSRRIKIRFSADCLRLRTLYILVIPA